MTPCGNAWYGTSWSEVLRLERLAADFGYTTLA
jgi:hypothetical protein